MKAKCLYVSVFLCLILFVFGCGSAVAPQPDPATNYLYSIYPNTTEAPVLTFYWGLTKQITVPATAVEIGPYGAWEGSGGGCYKPGYEPATECELHLVSYSDPIYAMCSGTVTWKQYSSTNPYGQEEGSVCVRYGKNYVVKYDHVTQMPTTYTVGSTIEKGAVIGYTERMGSPGGFWEVELDNLRSITEVVAIPILAFLDQASSVVFNDILVQTGQSTWCLPINSSTLESWLPYVGTFEMWADSNKVGLKDNKGYLGLEAFLALYNLSWIIN